MSKAGSLLVAVALTLALVLTMAGCSGNGDDDNAALTKSQFIKQADAICTQGLKNKDADLKQALAVASAAGADFESRRNQEKLVVTVAIPPLREIEEQLSELVPPEADEEKAEDMVDALDEGLSKAEEDPSLTLTSDVRILDKSNALAEEYGLSTCSKLG
jgi:hypothetical protein